MLTIALTINEYFLELPKLEVQLGQIRITSQQSMIAVAAPKSGSHFPVLSSA